MRAPEKKPPQADISEEKGAVGIQLFGAKPEIFKKAIEKIKKYNPSFIDINAGCPVPKVVKTGAGAALLKKPGLLHEIVKAAVEASHSIPVTVKLRAGWDRKNGPSFIECAKAAEEGGAAAVTLHARFRSDGFSGNADWKLIKELKKNISIPVIGNGDIKSVSDITAMFESTGCNSVMVGRAALGKPWFFKSYFDENNSSLSNEEKLSIAVKHFKRHISLYGEIKGIPSFRRHLAYYIKNTPGASKIRHKVMTEKTKEGVITALEIFFLKENV